MTAVNAGLNKGEARNALARAVFFHRLGEIRDRSFENQRYRASGLNLAVAAIILWNTVYLGRAVDQLRSGGEVVRDELLAHIAPLGCRQRPEPVLQDDRKSVSFYTKRQSSAGSQFNATRKPVRSERGSGFRCRQNCPAACLDCAGYAAARDPRNR
jgi:hypothetical protein